MFLHSCKSLSLFMILIFIACCSGNGGSGQDSRLKAAATEDDSRTDGFRPGKGGRLIIGLQQEPEILNEAINSMVSVIYVCNLIFSKFVKHTDALELVPDLITEIPTVGNGGISGDHLVYTYHLRPDALWHDGTPVTSADVKFSCEVMMHPDINVETRQGWDIVERVETPDRHTVVFHLREVYANFVGDCFYDESVLPGHLLEEWLGPSFQGADFHRRPTGSGPFAFHEWVAGSHITVRANKDYYGEGPYLDEIVIRFVPDGNALLLQLETGQVNGIDNAPITLLHVISSLEGVTLFRNPALFNEHIDLNCDNPILRDRNVRRALAVAIDRRQLSDKIYEGVWIPAYGDEHPSSPYYTGIGAEELAYDPQAAKRMLREAGWIDSDGDGIRERDGMRLSLTISTTAGRLTRESTEMVLKDQFERIGVELAVRNYHPTSLFASYDEGGILKRGTFDMALYAFLTPPDPSTKEGSYSMEFFPPKGQNHSRFRHETLTGLLSRGSRTVGFEQRKGIYDRVAKILAEEVPIIPLLWVTQLDVMPDRLRNYRPNPAQSGDTWNAAQWWLDEQ